MIATTTNIAPGVYPNLDFGTYLQIPAVNASAIKSAIKPFGHISIPHMVEMMEHGIDSTPSMRFGTLAHTGRLEPMQLMARYVVMPDYSTHPDNVDGKGEASTSWATTWAKGKKAEFEKMNEAKEIVTQAQYDDMLGLLTSLAENPEARRCFEDAGETELTVVWNDEITGLLCKARIDKVCRTLKRIPDLKTTADVFKFENQIFNLGYYVQQAWYQHGASMILGIEFEPWLVAVESSRPYTSDARPLEERAIDQGMRMCRKVLDMYADHLKGGSKNYINGAAFGLPEWGYDDGDDIEVTIGGTSAFAETAP